jgi:hypothetical protein
MFLDQLYKPPLGEGRGIGSFFVRRSVYFEIFGRLVPSKNTGNTPASQLQITAIGQPGENETPVQSLISSPNFQQLSSS